MKRLFMKTAQLACAFTFLLSNQSKAQIDTSTTKGLLQYIFQNIDKSQVPTGFLEEYGCPILPMATFNGTLTDSNRIDMNLWRTLYFQLQTGYVGSATNPLPAITSVNTTIKQTLAAMYLCLFLCSLGSIILSRVMHLLITCYRTTAAQNKFMM